MLTEQDKQLLEIACRKEPRHAHEWRRWSKQSPAGAARVWEELRTWCDGNYRSAATDNWLLPDQRRAIDVGIAARTLDRTAPATVTAPIDRAPVHAYPLRSNPTRNNGAMVQTSSGR